MINENKIREACASNRERGFKMLIDVFQEPIYNYIRRLVVFHEDAEDVLQEVFIRVFRHLDQFRSESSLSTWIYQIATNESLRLLNDRKEERNVASEEIQEELINKSSLIMEIGEEELTYIDGTKYNTLILKPYKSELIEVVQLPGTTDDDEALSVQQANRYITVDGVTRFYLSYKYRTLKTAATNDAPAEWNSWIEVYENMKVPTDD